MKAIETHYNGYKFRSRLEARWAVFFDTLGIAYQYEKEGYDFGEVKYLPDFWLPQQNIWIEIKGQEPTEEEIDKAYLLATATQKPVFILYGDVWLPPAYNAYMASPIIILVDEKESGDYRRSGESRQVDVPADIALLLWRIWKSKCGLSVNAPGFALGTEISVSLSLKTIAGDTERLRQLLELAFQRREEIVSALGASNLPSKRHLLINIVELSLRMTPKALYRTGLQWIICETCKEIHLHSGYFGSILQGRFRSSRTECRYDDAALHNAYTAARSARFEHK